MSEDATREALGTAEDTPVVEAGITVEFSEEEEAIDELSKRQQQKSPGSPLGV